MRQGDMCVTIAQLCAGYLQMSHNGSCSLHGATMQSSITRPMATRVFLAVGVEFRCHFSKITQELIAGLVASC